MSVPEVVISKETICLLNFEQADFFKVIVDSNIQKARGLKFANVYANQLAELERNEMGFGTDEKHVRYRSIKVLYQLESISDVRVRGNGQITAAAKQMAKELHQAEVAHYAVAAGDASGNAKKQKSSDSKSAGAPHMARHDGSKDLPAVPVKKVVKRRVVATMEDDTESADEAAQSPVQKRRHVHDKNEDEEDAKHLAKRAREFFEAEDEDIEYEI